MEIQLATVEWTSEDRRNLAEFLKSDSGLRLLPKLAEQVPSLMDGGDTNSILIRTGVVKGAQLAIQEILTLARPEPVIPEPTSPYPQLNDDSKWDDGQKLEVS